MRPLVPQLAVLPIAVLSICAAAAAETWTVNTDGTADYTDIQSAIDVASDGDTVVVYSGTYIWNGTGNGYSVIDTLGKAITVRGRLTPDNVFIDGEGVRRGVTCSTDEGPQTNIVNFTIHNCAGSSGGGVRLASSSPTISNCIIRDNTATAMGAGVYVEGGTPTITQCQIFNNDAGNSGGGLRSNFMGDPLLSQTFLCGNTPEQIYGGWSDGGGMCLTYGCTDSDGDGWPDKCGPVGDGVHHVPAEFATIQDAINAAGYGDEIIVAPGTWTGSGSAVIDPGGKQLYIHSSGGPSVTTLNGEGVRRCVQCVNGETNATIIEGFSLALGHSNYGGGGLYCFESAPQLVNCTVGWCYGGSFGGGVYVALSSNGDGDEPIIDGCFIAQNVADSSGSGLYVLSYDSEVLVRDTIFCGNLGSQINGAWLDAGGNCIAYACTDSDGDGVPDKCASTGDGVHLVPGEYATIQLAIEAAGDGDTVLVAPGTYTASGTNPVINPIGKRIHILASGSVADTIIDGELERRGLLCSTGETSLTTIEGFTFDNGGGVGNGATILFSNSSPKLVNSVIQNNQPVDRGGGVYFYNSNATLSDCAFALVNGSFGGALCAYKSNILVTDTTFGGCSANHGAAIALFGESTATFDSCISGFNLATVAGGMAYLAAGSKATFIDCTVGLSKAPIGPGIMAVNGAKIRFEGVNACAGTWCGDPGSAMTLHTDATCDVDDDVTTSPQGALTIDLHDLTFGTRLKVDGTLLRQGSLAITNISGSLSGAIGGETYQFMQANVLEGSFSSIVMPVMPAGLGLQLVEQSGNGSTAMVLEVIEVEDIDLDDPFAENLDSPPLDMVSFDADGDGADELAVLFGGTPGGVAIYTITEDAPPALIPELITTAGNSPVDMDAGDLNGDGLDDLIIASGDDSTLTVLLTEVDEDGVLSFATLVVDVPGYGQAVTCGAIIDWDGDANLDAVVGIDRDNPAIEDAWQVLLDVGLDTTSTGATLNIPLYEHEAEAGVYVIVSDAPTTVTGGQNPAEAWGFCGGTNYGQLLYAQAADGILLTIGETGGGRISAIEAMDMDEDGGDGLLDILAASAEHQSIYLIPADFALPSGFDDMIPIAVSEPVENIVALDADDDGDIDIVLASPTSTDDPLLLLRNDPPAGGLLPLAARTWSKKSMSGSNSTLLSSGSLNNKDDEDDWVIGGGDGDGLRGSGIGEIEQTNMFPAAIPGDTCASAVTARSGANSFDTTVLSDSGFGDPDESFCPNDYLDWYSSSDMWFRWTASANGSVSFTTCDAASYDTSLVLYAGATCDAIAQVACNGDAPSDADCQQYYSHILDVPVTTGDTLYVRIGGWQAATGVGTLTIDVAGCPEDIDGNGVVDVDDLLLILSNFNGSGVGDVDGNGIVDVDDLLLVIGAWNASC